MLAKKESFLKYLHDEEITPNIKFKKLNSNIKKEKPNNKTENNDEIILPKENGLNNKQSSFQNFVNEIKNYDYNKKIKWESEIHKSSLISDINSHKIKLMELGRINYVNPLLFLNKEYTKPNYQSNLFEQEIIHIIDQIKISHNKKDYNIIDNSKIFMQSLIEEKEKFELNKNIIKYYLEYYCENNIEKIAPSFKEIRTLEEEVNLYYEKIHKGKERINELKKFNIDNTMKLILKKKKYQNMMKLYCFLKNNVLKYYKEIKKLKLKNMNFDYINYYNEMNRIINNIDLLEKNSEILVKENRIKNLLFIEGIRNKLKKKKDKFNLKYISEINKLFDSKKSNILQLYQLFNIDNSIDSLDTKNNEINKINLMNNQSNLFVSKMAKNFKLRSKKLILETLNFYKKKEKKNSNSITILNLNDLKLSEINNIQIDDSNIIICFKNILSKLKTHVDNFFYYFNLICQSTNENINNINKENLNLKEELISRKNEFYEIIDKHLSKLLKLFYNPKEKQNDDKILPKKYFLIIINLLCLFGKLLKIKFELNYSKYLNLALKNYIVNYIKSENKNTLSRAFILLKNDFWEKTILDKSYLDINNIKEKTPFYLKKFINFLNEEELEENENINVDINKDNIENIFNHIINNDNNINNMNFDEIVDLYNNKKGIKFIINKSCVKILNKPLKYNYLYINNSSMCILRGIEEQIINFIIFEFLIYEIFTYLFNSVDLYIFICFKMFLNDNKYLNNLLKNINIKEIQKDLGNIEYWSDVISYQEKFSEIKKFIISSEKKFYEFHGYNKKFQNEEEKQNFIVNLIPKLKEVLITNNNDNNNILDCGNIINDKDDNKSESNNNDDKNKLINKTKDKGILSVLRSAVDDIGDGLSKAKDTAKNFLKSNNQNINLALIQELEQKISENNFKHIIIFISCISTFYKILKRLVDFTSKIELDFQKNQINEKISKYKTLIGQITYFFYMKISLNLISFEQISPLIENSDWCPTPEVGASQLFESSFWVNKIINLFECILDIMMEQYSKIFEEKKLVKYISILIKYIVSNIQDNFSKIKNCNDTGRSIMLKDIKFLKQGIENSLKKYNYNIKIKTNELFDVIVQFINAWYYNTDELTKFIFDNNIQYRYFQSFLYSSPSINNLSQEKKNQFINDIKQKYLLRFKKVIPSLKN